MARILVVDDDDDIRLVLSTALTRAGHDVLEAPDGRQALSLLSDGHVVDAVVVDATMPGVDGFDLLHAIRSDHRRSDLAVVFCSARGEPEARARARALGVDAYVEKPFDPATVTARVDELVALSAAGRRARRAHP